MGTRPYNTVTAWLTTPALRAALPKSWLWDPDLAENVDFALVVHLPDKQVAGVDEMHGQQVGVGPMTDETRCNDKMIPDPPQPQQLIGSMPA